MKILSWKRESFKPVKRFRGVNFVEDSDGERRQSGEENVVETDCPSLEENLSGPAWKSQLRQLEIPTKSLNFLTRINRKPQLDDVKTNILVETVKNQLAHPRVVPSAVHK